MGPVTGVIVFLLIWWTALFAVLPFGHQRDETGKPVVACIGRKFLWTSLVSVVLWCIVFVLIASDIISFREIALEMIAQDERRQ